MTEEHKKKIQEGRKKALEIRKANGEPLRIPRKSKRAKGSYVNDKPVLVLTGKEKNMFDLWEAMRITLRPMKLNLLCHKLEKEIQDVRYWQNTKWMAEKLSTWLHIEYEVSTEIVKEKKPRKKRTYVMTEEHKAKLQSARIKARENK
jgi:hypothetical protein